MSIKVDVSLCTGCRACLLACSLKNFQVFNPRAALLRNEEKEEDIPLVSVSKYILERSESMYAMSLFNPRRAALENMQEFFILPTRAGNF